MITVVAQANGHPISLPSLTLFHSRSFSFSLNPLEGPALLSFKPFLVALSRNMQFFFVLAVLALFVGQGEEVSVWKGREGLMDLDRIWPER